MRSAEERAHNLEQYAHSLRKQLDACRAERDSLRSMLELPDECIYDGELEVWTEYNESPFDCCAEIIRLREALEEIELMSECIIAKRMAHAALKRGEVDDG